MRNARFWVYLNGNGPVKLTLKPGQRLQWGRAWSHDEGWSSESESWEYDDEIRAVVNEWQEDGTDCDGRLTRYGTRYCPVELLQSGNAHDDTDYTDIIYPAWQRGECGQRDYTAEAAGY